MNGFHSIQAALAAARVRLTRDTAYTAAEMAVTTGLFTLVMGSMLSLYIFSSRSTSGVMRQLELDSQARVLNKVIQELKSSSAVDIQTYDGTAFTSVADGQPQQGNALSITASNGEQVLYWVDSSGDLYRAIAGSNMSKRWMSNVTNSNPFVARDYTGAVLSNDTPRTLIDITIQALDTNVRNFQQSVTLKTAVAKRN